MKNANVKKNNRKFLLCRDIENSLKTKEKLEKLDFQASIFPLYKVNNLPMIAPFKSYDGAIITSMNVIHSQKLEFWQKLNKKETFFVVGKGLSEYLKKHDITDIKAFNSVLEIVSYIREHHNLHEFIYFRGHVVSYDLKHHLTNEVDEIICYDVEFFNPHFEKIEHVLRNDRITDLIFFSKEIAANFLKILKDANQEKILKNYEIFCLSERIAEVFFGYSKNIHYPRIANFSELVKLF
jgi:uroporphyrinogen-III synthase